MVARLRLAAAAELQQADVGLIGGVLFLLEPKSAPPVAAGIEPTQPA
jgi:hypothetical protein